MRILSWNVPYGISSGGNADFSRTLQYIIINTHLAFHDDTEYSQQVGHLNHLEQERVAHHREPKRVGTGTCQEGFLASAQMLCGDFNFTP